MNESVRTSPSNFNIPNMISIARILMVPVFILFMIQNRPRAAFTMFLIAALTDLLDGFAARLLKQKTPLGALLDPAGDKALMTSAVVLLSLPGLETHNTLPLWLTMIILGRDIVLVLGALILYRLIGKKAFPPLLSGKASTVLQMGLIVLVLFANMQGVAYPALGWLYPLTGAVTMISGIQYARTGLSWFRERR